jgi:16S rRNA (cytosine967-C5)-methyltransferase
VLARVADQGAYASRALDAELSRSRLNPPDAALATEIVYGALRLLPELDARYGAFLRDDPKALDAVARATLRAGTYQLLYLTRVPAHAVVDESVSIIRDARGPRLGGLVNAVLRKVAKARPAEGSASEGSASEAGPSASPSRLVVPQWVRRAIEESLGEQRTQTLLDAGAETRSLPPPLGLRVAQGLDRDVVAAEIRAALPEARVEPGRVSSSSLLVWKAGDVRKLAAYERGAITTQEEGSQWVAACLGAQPGERIADLCAGHGGKTTWLAERVGPKGYVLAVDLDERKLERIPVELRRLHMDESRVELRAIDLSKGTGGLDASFDRVLIDAACTGLGTLRRRPDLLLRLSEQDPSRLGALQYAMLCNAARIVRPQGTLLYAVCSPTLDEGARVIERFEREVPGFVREWVAPSESPELAPDADGMARIGPWLGPERLGAEQLGAERAHESPDAYQVARFRRV